MISGNATRLRPPASSLYLYQDFYIKTEFRHVRAIVVEAPCRTLDVGYIQTAIQNLTWVEFLKLLADTDTDTDTNFIDDYDLCKFCRS